ncbi:MAG: RsmB/NOP family class I SAM-dependent RNA methyltransferase, partial [Bacteroidales bacterium]|nr:RsmB/NOP family class I SAM-dependent RNA methyltransferase [Bacteroidales bacterium]
MEGIEDRVLMDILSRAVGPERAPIAFDALSQAPSISVRYNPFKLSSDKKGSVVPWNKYGVMLSERPRFVMDPLFHAGCYYVQDSSAMVVGHIFREHLDDFEGLGRPVRVLDLCAAPGGKTTDLAASLRERFGDGFQLVANEVMRNRASVLADNVAIWGDPNVIVTSCDPKAFSKLEGFFDVLVVDAPCSGEGMFRKDPKAVEDWSLEAVELCAARQKRILADAWPSLRQNGLLIYST